MEAVDLEGVASAGDARPAGPVTIIIQTTVVRGAPARATTGGPDLSGRVGGSSQRDLDRERCGLLVGDNEVAYPPG